ncbi:phosphotransferase [Kitasatospora sp. NPDC001540]|uniref:phosphotransferase n=1 Tax=Kitasatospora sp. NPDC001540 TaxID=3364014 RepID=UPI003690DD15
MKRIEFDEQAYARRSRSGPCFICRLLAGDEEFRHEIVHRDEQHVVFLDRYPTLLGKLLVAPVAHRQDVIGDFTAARSAALWHTVHRAGAALRQVVPTERIYLQSLGSHSGNSHVHVHVAALPPGVPYEQQQTAALAWESAGLLDVPPEETARIAGRLRAVLALPPAPGPSAAAAGPVPVQARHREPVDVHLLLRRDGAAGPEVLLTRRAGAVYATGLEHLPSGHIDGSHEDAVQALIREAREETGVVVDPDDVRHAVTVHHRGPGGDSRVGLVFEVLRWNGEPAIREPDLCDAMGWYPLADLPAGMVAYCRAALDAYRAGHRFAVHFQEPGDTVAYDPHTDRLRAFSSAGTGEEGPGRAVREFTERAVGRLSSWTDVSWARPGSRVWRVDGAGGGRWYVKIHQNPRFHGREVAAYRTWVPGLGAAAPRLVAADADLLAVVVTALPGTSLHGAVHPPGQQREIFRRIGALAAAIHRPAPAAGPDETLRAALGKLERQLDGARAHLAPGDEEAVRALAARADLLPQPEPVFTHGDLQLRNLLLGEAGELYVIDFERAQPGPALRDFVRLADLWAHRPDLLEALADGYGRPFTAAELEYLAVLEALDAVSGVQYGAACGDPELLERGLRTLTRLRTAADRLAAGRKDTV